MTALSKRLAGARTTLKISQEELAKRAGCSQSLIGNLEAGRQASSTKIPQIASVLGLNPLWLAEGKGPREQPGPSSREGIPAPAIDSAFLTRCLDAVDAYISAGGRKASRSQRVEVACVLYSTFAEPGVAGVDEMVVFLERWLAAARRGATDIGD